MLRKFLLIFTLIFSISNVQILRPKRGKETHRKGMFKNSLKPLFTSQKQHQRLLQQIANGTVLDSLYSETENAFVTLMPRENTTSEVLQMITQSISGVSTRFEILSQPVKGYINGAVKVLYPNGTEMVFDFKKEETLVARCRITLMENLYTFYEGPFYWRLSGFNPIRSLKNFTFVAANSESLVINNDNLNRFFELSKNVLALKKEFFNSNLSLFIYPKLKFSTGFSYNKLIEDNITDLEEAVSTIMNYLDPNKFIKFVSIKVLLISGNFTTLSAQGDLNTTEFTNKEVLNVSFIEGGCNLKNMVFVTKNNQIEGVIVNGQNDSTYKRYVRRLNRQKYIKSSDYINGKPEKIVNLDEKSPNFSSIPSNENMAINSNVLDCLSTATYNAFSKKEPNKNSIRDLLQAIGQSLSYNLADKFEIRFSPVEGFIDGYVSVLNPEGSQENFYFQRENAIRAEIIIKNVETSEIYYQGPFYWVKMGFNPVRSAHSDYTNTNFTSLNNSFKESISSKFLEVFFNNSVKVLNRRNDIFQNNPSWFPSYFKNSYDYYERYYATLKGLGGAYREIMEKKKVKAIENHLKLEAYYLFFLIDPTSHIQILNLQISRLSGEYLVLNIDGILQKYVCNQENILNVVLIYKDCLRKYQILIRSDNFLDKLIVENRNDPFYQSYVNRRFSIIFMNMLKWYKIIEDSSSFVSNSPRIEFFVESILRKVGQRLSNVNSKFEILDNPIRGRMNGKGLVLYPNGSEREFVFDNETGYKVFCRITNMDDLSKLYEGAVYWKGSSFNPIRAALGVKSTVTFTPDGGLPQEILGSDQNKFIESSIKLLKNEQDFFRIAVNGNLQFTPLSEIELQDERVLKNEILKILKLLFPTRFLVIQNLNRTKITGNYTLFGANGRTAEKFLDQQDILLVRFFTNDFGLKEYKEYRFLLPFLIILFQASDKLPNDDDDFYKNKFEGVKTALNDSKISLDDRNGDLVRPGFFKGRKLAIFQANYIIIKDLQKGWLEESGFEIYCSYNSKDFVNYLSNNDPDLIWVVSDDLGSSKETYNSIIAHYRKGAHLFLWTDNEPFFQQANGLLNGLFGSICSMQGNYYGTKTLKPGVLYIDDKSSTGTFDSSHPVSTGFSKLYEGITISFPKPECQQLGFRPFAYNTNPTNLEIMAMYKPASGTEGTIWVDTGFTKLDSGKINIEEVKRYVVNVNAYLLYSKTFELMNS